VRDIADQRVYGTRGAVPIERFRRAEAGALRSIAGVSPFAMARELVRMTLLGRFHGIPEHLFISRHCRGRSKETLPARLTDPRRFRLTKRHCRLPGPERWDPSKVRAITFPEFRLLREYFLSIYRCLLRTGQKAGYTSSTC
jgi:hypothetical protein